VCIANTFILFDMTSGPQRTAHSDTQAHYKEKVVQEHSGKNTHLANGSYTCSIQWDKSDRSLCTVYAEKD
jgi:hypothetical protein